MFDAVKARVISQAPWGLPGDRPAVDVSWVRLLLAWMLYEVLIAAGWAVALVVVV
ncbi:MAG: hypothetical protein QOI01_4047 [Mycobacterium sp.]|jgi:hypothetical protein|nr:hypothetical protein [Mycobacterium sp.]